MEAGLTFRPVLLNETDCLIGHLNITMTLDWINAQAVVVVVVVVAAVVVVVPDWLNDEHDYLTGLMKMSD